MVGLRMLCKLSARAQGSGFSPLAVPALKAGLAGDEDCGLKKSIADVLLERKYVQIVWIQNSST